MSRRTYTRIFCNGCQQQIDEPALTATNYHGDTLDLCDPCVEAGYSLKRLSAGVVRLLDPDGEPIEGY